jgi:hypothetical protein
MQGTAARQAQGDGSQKLAPDPDPEACKRASPSSDECSTAGSLARRMQLAHAIPVQTMQPRTAGPLTFVARPHDETPRY